MTFQQPSYHISFLGLAQGPGLGTGLGTGLRKLKGLTTISGGGGGAGGVVAVDEEAQEQGHVFDFDPSSSSSLVGDIIVVQRSYLLTMKREMWDGGILERNRQDEGTFGSHLQVGDVDDDDDDDVVDDDDVMKLSYMKPFLTLTPPPPSPLAPLYYPYPPFHWLLV